jgi:hypothetical protein
MGVGQGGGEATSCLRIFLLNFYNTEGFPQSQEIGNFPIQGILRVPD